jgi:SEC-C motif-containing protein
MTVCPCRLQDKNPLAFKDCCAPFLEASQPPPSAEALMRSRYSAYAVGNVAYIEKTQLQEEGDSFDAKAAQEWADNSDWLGLKILSTKAGQIQDQTGFVEFEAHYQDKKTQKKCVHKEISHFVKVQNEWKFREGSIRGAGPLKRLTPKVGRNDPCSCGSEKKFKKCCGTESP